MPASGSEDPDVPACACHHHCSSAHGHGDVDETFDIVATCPVCQERDVLRLCTGRVLALLGDPSADFWVTCPVCETSAPAKAFWSTPRRTTGIPSADQQAPSCRRGRLCVGC